MTWDSLQRFGASLIVALLPAACDQEPAAPEAATPAEAAASPAASTAEPFPAARATATIRGVVTFAGEVPEKRTLAVAGVDPYCDKCFAAGPPVNESYEIDAASKGVAHCFVEVLDADKRWQFEVPPDPVLLDQVNCRYTPHTFGIMVGQELVVTSSDDTDHNVHFRAKLNRVAKPNFIQKKGQKDRLRFTRPENALFQCDIHSWMNANVHIRRHPLWAVSDAKGEFVLPKLPAGEYRLQVAHEKWKGQTLTVTVGDGETKSVELEVRQ